MFGKTNSVIAASGGGDVVEAVNNMGVALQGGEKVWLNRHIFESSHAQKVGGGTGSTIHAYNLKNKFYYQQGANLIRADFKNEAWSFPAVGATDSVKVRSIQFKNDVVWEYVDTSKSIILREMGNATVVAGIAVAEDMAVIAKKICTIDTLTGATLVTGGTVNPVSSSNTNAAFVFGNVLFVGLENKGFYFYDISDVSAPVLLKQGTFSTTEMVVYATGLDVGDYLISRNGLKPSEWDGGVLHIYQIKEGYTLVTATDLPAGLSYFIGRTSRVSYNNDTGVLSVGTTSELRFFKFDGKVFGELDIVLPALPETKSNCPYLARSNDDMSILTISCTHGSSYTYYDVWFYRLVGFDEQWYAEPYSDSSAASFTGFAKGETESGAVVSVKTVFPQLLTLTIEVEDDGAVIEVKGAK